MDNVHSNNSDYKNIEKFLEKIKWRNRPNFIAKVRKAVLKDLTDSLETTFRNLGKSELVDEINLLNCFEILKKMEIELSYDFNYLDFDCSIPVARNLRNYLAHGDLEIFCPYLKEIIQSHLSIISKTYKGKSLKGIGYWQSDDLKAVKSDLDKHRKWAREVWETLNLTSPLKREQNESFKVRDHNNQSVVHYNLLNVEEENCFLMYLIKKVTENPTFEANVFFEKMLKESKTYNCKDGNAVEYFIDKFLDERQLQEKRRLLCIILCFNYQNLDMFRKVYSIHFDTTQLLCYAIANTQFHIVDLLLEQIESHDNFELILKITIKNDNKQLLSKLIDLVCKDPLKHDINWPSLVILAAEMGNIEILKLLSRSIPRFNSDNRNLLIKTTINFNSNTRICQLVVEKYLSPISITDSELLLCMCCFDERYEILKYLLEKVVPENHWQVIRKSILISCFNVISLEIVDYLIENGAYLEHKTIDNFLPFFESADIVYRFGYLTPQQNSKKLTFVRNKNVAEVFHKLGYSLDWFEIDCLPLEFILKKNPEPKIKFKKLIGFIRKSSSKAVTSFLKYLKDHEIQFPFRKLPKFVAESRLRAKKWFSELKWTEPNEDDFTFIIDNAIEKKYLTYVRMIFRKTTTINLNERMNMLAFITVYHKQEQILQLFKEYETDLNIKFTGRSLLDIAITLGQGTITDTMRLLSKYGVKSDRDIDFYNITAQDMLLFGVLAGNMDTIKEGHSLGADINFKYEKYRLGTVLHITAYNILDKKMKIRNLIVNLGIDTTIRDIDNYTAFELDPFYDLSMKIPKDCKKMYHFHLFWSGVLRNDIELMEEALEKGAGVNSVYPGLGNFTALHSSAFNGTIPVVQFLLNNGADPLKTNITGQYPIEMAIKRDNCDIFSILYSKNLNLGNYFVNALQVNSVKIVNFLLEEGFDVNTKILNKCSALNFACAHPNNKGLKLAEVLIDHKINLTTSDVSIALKEKNYELVNLILYRVHNYPKTVQEFEILLEDGLNINLVLDSDFESYLQIAFYLQHKEVVKYLLDNGANFLQNNLLQKNPITIALRSNNDLKKLFFKPLLVKFYSMWSKYPSVEFNDFYNIDLTLRLHTDQIIVFWFDMILRISGLLDNDDIPNLTPYELLASGLWFNNISYIKRAIEFGIDLKQGLTELVFVSLVLNFHKVRFFVVLGLVLFGRDWLMEIKNVFKFCKDFLQKAVLFYESKEFKMHPRLSEVFESILNSETNISKEYEIDNAFNFDNVHDFKILLTDQLDLEEYFKTALLTNRFEIALKKLINEYLTLAKRIIKHEQNYTESDSRCHNLGKLTVCQDNNYLQDKEKDNDANILQNNLEKKNTMTIDLNDFNSLLNDKLDWVYFFKNAFSMKRGEYALNKLINEYLKLFKRIIKHEKNVTKTYASLAWNKKNYELFKLILTKVFNYPKTVQEFEVALEKGLNINLSPGSDLRSYLHIACHFENKKIVKLLLENGANFLQKNIMGKNSLTIALESNCGLKRLFFKPLLVKFYSMWSKYPSEEFTEFYNTDPEKDFNYIIVFWFNMILRVSCLLDNDDLENLTAFEILASGLFHNNISYIKKAIEFGVDLKECLSGLVFVSSIINYHKDEGKSALDLGMVLFGRDWVKEIKKIIKISDEFLFKAVPFFHSEEFEMHPRFSEVFVALLNKNADISEGCDIERIFNVDNLNEIKTILPDLLDLENYLEEKGLKKRVEFSVMKNHMKKIIGNIFTEIIEGLINANGIDINTVSSQKINKIDKLISYNGYKYPKTVQEFEILIENGFNVNLNPASNIGTILHLACYFQDEQIVKILLDNGANFLQNDLDENNPITNMLRTNSVLKKLFFKPLLVKFYSMWSSYPSEEFNDFYNTDLEKDFDYIIVFWFDAILRVSGLLDNDGIQNLTPFELLASGLWFNNISLIEKAIDAGVDINQCLRELVFVSHILNSNSQKLMETLVFIFFNGGDVSREIENAKLLYHNLLNIAVPLLDSNKLELHPHFEKAIKDYEINELIEV